ncbi:MAG: DUF393 domain-containing protein [Rhodobacteraceae bacterium]|nr:DUF393 domain-containing protein [Paracoccaceae bacterium]
MPATVYYDGECPFCDRYVRLIHLREAVGAVRLVNLRDHVDSRCALEAEGFDLDDGMVVEIDGKRRGGADAAHALALLSTPSSLFNRFNRLLLSSKTLSRITYPVLRAGRWIILFLLGRKGFAAEDPGLSARAAIFSQFFALFSFFHFFNYALEYGRFPPGWDQGLLLISAIALFFKPKSERLLLLLMLTSTISAIVQAPAQSNHTMIRHAVLLGYWLSFGVAWARGSNWQAIFARFAPAGQGALLVMYVFGIFHKINADFLNPETSCAVALWQELPIPLSLIEGLLIDYAVIYGTFIIEGVLIVMLLTPRWRHTGIIGGILFHTLLALSGYAMYITFTMLSIALHTLFISGDAAQRITQSPELKTVQTYFARPLFLLSLLILVAVMTLAALLRDYSTATLMVLPIILPLAWAVFRYGRTEQPLIRPGPFWATHAVGVITTLLLFANCTAPYLGLKTAQAVGMFANLRLEAGVSNHLIMPVPGPFTYLEQVAVIEDAGSDLMLKGYKRNDYAIVYYDLLARLQETPDNKITFTRNGVRHVNVGAADLAAEIDATLHPAWFRKWFHFQQVKLTQPEPCNV